MYPKKCICLSLLTGIWGKDVSGGQGVLALGSGYLLKKKFQPRVSWCRQRETAKDDMDSEYGQGCTKDKVSNMPHTATLDIEGRRA